MTMNQHKQDVKKSMKQTETDTASMIPIVQEKYEYVFKLFLRKTGDSDIAADLTQTLFLKLMRSYKNLRHPEAINSFIETIATNCLHDFYKSIEIDKRIQDAAHEFKVHEFKVHECEPSKLAEKEETSTKLNEIFLSLPRMCFECVCLRYLEGLDYKEIAKKLNISVNSVGVYIMRAHNMLRENPFVRSLLEKD